MTIGGIVAIAFLVIMAAFVVRGIWGHRRRGDTSDDLDSWAGGGDGRGGVAGDGE